MMFYINANLYFKKSIYSKLYILSLLHVCIFLFQSSIAAGLSAKQWVSEVVPLISGKGGGSDASAQATGSACDALSEALKTAIKFAELKLS